MLKYVLVDYKLKPVFSEPLRILHIILRPLATATASLMRNLIPMVPVLASTTRMTNSTLRGLCDIAVRNANDDVMNLMRMLNTASRHDKTLEPIFSGYKKISNLFYAKKVSI